MKNRHDLNTMILDEYWLQLNKKGFSLYRIYPILTSWQRVPCSYWSFASWLLEKISCLFIWLHRRKGPCSRNLVIFSQCAHNKKDKKCDKLLVSLWLFRWKYIVIPNSFLLTSMFLFILTIHVMGSKVVSVGSLEISACLDSWSGLN